MNRWSKVAAVFLLAGAAVAVTAMVHGAGSFQLNWFYPWVLLPYGVLFVVFCLPRTPSHARSVAAVMAALLVFLFSAWFYVDAMWVSVSSTSALVFVFTPAWLTIGGLMAWGLAWWLLSLRNRHR